MLLRSLQKISLVAAIGIVLCGLNAASPVRAEILSNNGDFELLESQPSQPNLINLRLQQIKKELQQEEVGAIATPVEEEAGAIAAPVEEEAISPATGDRTTRINTPLALPKKNPPQIEPTVIRKSALPIKKSDQKSKPISQSVALPDQISSTRLDDSQSQPLVASMPLSVQAGTPMLYPLPHTVPVTSGFGWRWGRIHKGIDLGVPTGTPVNSAFAGVIIASSNAGDGYGNKVIVLNDNNTRTLYAHLDRIFVQPRQRVSAGEIVGLSGSTGNSTGPHLHLELQVSTEKGWQAVNFLPWLQSAEALIAPLNRQGQSSSKNTSLLPHTPEQTPAIGVGGGEEPNRLTLFHQIGIANPDLKRSAVLKSNEIRVALAVRSPAVQIGSSTPSWILDASGSPLDYIPSGQAFITVPHGNQIQIGNERLPGRFFIQPINNGFVNVNGSWYRGRILVSLDRGKLTVVNWLDMETYTASVVGGESFPSWNSEALKAQAIAARSYALNFRYKPAAQLYDLGNTESHQVYKGTATEFNTTWAAVNATRGQVVIDLQTNSVMLTQYAATQALVDSAHGGYNSMSQSGASEMANQGYSYLQILGRYYRNAAIRVFRSG